MHSPQSMHLSAMMRAVPSRTRIAPTGQVVTQTVQPLQDSSSRITE
jgi:hypothetical protein